MQKQQNTFFSSKIVQSWMPAKTASPGLPNLQRSTWGGKNCYTVRSLGQGFQKWQKIFSMALLNTLGNIMSTRFITKAGGGGNCVVFFVGFLPKETTALEENTVQTFMLLQILLWNFYPGIYQSCDPSCSSTIIKDRHSIWMQRFNLKKNQLVFRGQSGRGCSLPGAPARSHREWCHVRHFPQTVASHTPVGVLFLQGALHRAPLSSKYYQCATRNDSRSTRLKKNLSA